MTNLSLAEILTQAVSSNDQSQLREILPLVKYNEVLHALKLAAYTGKPQCVEIILPFCTPINPDNQALQMAAAAGHVECVQLLLPFLNPNTNKGEALSVAALNNHVECVKLLIPHTNPKCYSYALHDAVVQKSIPCVQIILDTPCCAEEVLTEMQRVYANPPRFWDVLEQCILIHALKKETKCNAVERLGRNRKI